MGYPYCELHCCPVCCLDDDVREECDKDLMGCTFCELCTFVEDSDCDAPAQQV